MDDVDVCCDKVARKGRFSRCLKSRLFLPFMDCGSFFCISALSYVQAREWFGKVWEGLGSKKGRIVVCTGASMAMVFGKLEAFCECGGCT